MTIRNRPAVSAADRQDLLERLEPRLKVEDYFRRSGRTFRKSRFRLWFNRRIKKLVLKVAFLLTGIYRRGIRNALALRARRIEFHFSDLPPAFEGFEILHLSDLHIDEIDGLAEALVARLEGLRPDLCVLTGDYRYEISGPCEEVFVRMRKVLSAVSAACGSIAILGNHDSSEIALELESMGVRMLVNEATELERAGQSIWIAGIDDQFDYRCADLVRAMSEVPRSSFSILLAHDPTFFEDAAARGIQLYLCGHTHAGQVRLPFLGAVKKNAPVPRKFVQDAWTHNSMQGYTSWGAGCSTLPVRYNCPPEITLIKLSRLRL